MTTKQVIIIRKDLNRDIDPNEVIRFIEDNFDLEQKTGGFVSIKERLETNNALQDLVSL